MTAGGSSIVEVQALLGVLAASKRGGRFAEAGTAFGDGALAIARNISSDARLVTVETDPGRAAVARGRLPAGGVELVVGRWDAELPARAPFDLLFLDAPASTEGFEPAISSLAPGGILVKDDLTPGRDAKDDPVRRCLLDDPRLVGVELAVSREMAVIVAVRRAA